MCEQRPATTTFAFPVCDECAEWLGKLDVQLKAEEAADPELAALGQRVEDSARALFDAGQQRARQRAQDVQDLRDKPRCDVHGTALARVVVTLPLLAPVASWRCMFCDLEVRDAVL